MSLLRELNRAGALRTLDDALARSLQRLDPDTPDSVLAGAALASLAVAHGHAGFDPAAPRQLVDADIAWPPAVEWLAAAPGVKAGAAAITASTITNLMEKRFTSSSLRVPSNEIQPAGRNAYDRRSAQAGGAAAGSKDERRR